MQLLKIRISFILVLEKSQDLVIIILQSIQGSQHVILSPSPSLLFILLLF